MSKKARIAELEREVARLTGLYAAEREKNETQVRIIRKLHAEARPSLRDAAKREWQQLTERLLASVGL